MSQYPLGFGQWLQALSYAVSKPREIAIIGDPDSADTQALLNVVRDGYRPFQVVALGSPHADRPGREDVQMARVHQLPSNVADGIGSIVAVTFLQDRGLMNGQAAAYVCRGSVCQAPAEEPEGLRAQLDRR